MSPNVPGTNLLGSNLFRAAAFGGGLVIAFGAAFAVGGAASPLERGVDSDVTSAHGGDMAGGNMAGADEGAAHAEPGAPGLAVSQAGYTFVPAASSLDASRATAFRFTVTGPDGVPVTAYTQTHTKDLHLVVVRRDLSGFQHVHPTRTADGTWSVDLDLSAPGTYRAFADFEPTALAEKITLGADLQVAGAFVPVPLPAATTTTSVDGYTVALRGDPVAGAESDLTFTVTRDGRPVADLEPYLGAFGHLVALRVGDLAYLHTHPGDEAEAGSRGGPAVDFMTEFPTAGTYRLFLDFSAGGSVHTAELTVDVPKGDRS